LGGYVQTEFCIGQKLYLVTFKSLGDELKAEYDKHHTTLFD
jgi:hypothetical protein